MPQTSLSSQRNSLPFAVDRENAVKTRDDAGRTGRPSIEQILGGVQLFKDSTPHFA
jgi:hypothetical protein